MRKTAALQMRQLELLLHFRDHPISIAGLIWCSRQQYIALLTMMVASTVVIYWRFRFIGVAFAGAAYGATFIRDLAYMRSSKASWPVLREIIDWEKVEVLKQESRASR